MKFEPHQLYHLHTRTFNGTLAFPTRANYLFFRDKLRRLRKSCDILCYCLMPDHFEIIVHLPVGSLALRRTANDQMQIFCRQIGNLLSSYARAYNKQVGRRGSLFQPRTKSKVLNDDAVQLFDFIHNKPVRAGLVFNAVDWEFSSRREYARGTEGICNRALAAELLRRQR